MYAAGSLIRNCFSASGRSDWAIFFLLSCSFFLALGLRLVLNARLAEVMRPSFLLAYVSFIFFSQAQRDTRTLWSGRAASTTSYLYGASVAPRLTLMRLSSMLRFADMLKLASLNSPASR